MRRRCLVPGCAVVTSGSRCAFHQAERDVVYRGDWPRVSRAAIAAWRAEHGDWCPGWGVPPHASSDLTADHVDPRRLGRGVRVLCRSCNSRRGDRDDSEQGGGVDVGSAAES